MNKNVRLYTLGAAMAAVATIVALLLVLGARGGSGTAEAGNAVGNPPPNGTCSQVTELLWPCDPDDPSLLFNRVDVYVAISDQDLKVQTAQFDCRGTFESVQGVFKGIKEGRESGAVPEC